MSSAQYPIDEDPRDEGRLADLVSAGMWTTAGLVGAAMFALPGSSHDHLLVGLAVAGAGVLWGVDLARALPHALDDVDRRPRRGHGHARRRWWPRRSGPRAAPPASSVRCCSSRRSSSPTSSRRAWPGRWWRCSPACSPRPLLYDPSVVETAYPARALAFAVAIAGESFVIQLLKRRLLRAEARQRVMAERDPLTALYNRRSFDAALEQALARPDGVALVLFDFDELQGASTTSTATRSATRCCAPSPPPATTSSARATAWPASAATSSPSSLRARARPAWRASSPRSRRRSPAPSSPTGSRRVRASFAWAVAPADAQTAPELLDRADQRLLYRKRLSKSASDALRFRRPIGETQGDRMRKVAGGLVRWSLRSRWRSRRRRATGRCERYAEGTWRSFAAMTDERSGLPSDILERDGTRSVQTSTTNIGAYMWSAVAAEKLGHHPPLRAGGAHAPHAHDARGHGAARAERPVLQLVRPPDGREADDLAAVAASRSRRSSRRSTTAGWPSACKIVAEPRSRSCRAGRSALYDSMNFGFYYRPDVNRMLFHYVPGHRRGAVLLRHDRQREPDRRPTSAIAKGEMPAARALRARTARSPTPATGAGPRRGRSASRAPTSAAASTTARCPTTACCVTPSWGGSMFEALMPSLFVPEERWGPGSWGANHPLTVRRADPPRAGRGRLRLLGLLAGQHPGGRLHGLRRRRDRQQPGRLPVEQRPHARSTTAGRAARTAEPQPDPPPSAYTNGVVTPHAAFLALRYAPREALANLAPARARLRHLHAAGASCDSVNVDTGVVSDSYLSLDQGMIMAAIGNALGHDVLRRAFATRDVERELRPVIGVEEFSASPRPCTITGTPRRRPPARHARRRRDLRPRRRRRDRRPRRRRRAVRRRRPRPDRRRRRRRHALRRRGRRPARRRARRRRAVGRPGSRRARAPGAAITSAERPAE